MEQVDYDLIIVGGGPAGLAAGLYASRGGLKTLLIEKMGAGGPVGITKVIENYPGFPEGIQSHELMDRIAAQAGRFGLTIKTFCCGMGLTLEGKVKKVAVENEEKTEYTSHAAIIATGAHPKRLGVPGEKEFTGKGVSYCATCDGPLFKDKKILVVGGGNAAVEEALFLSKFASELIVSHRRDQLRADKVLQDRAFANSKIKFLWNTELREVQGSMVVERAIIENNKTGERQELPVSGVFIYVGTEPNTEFLQGVLKLDENGYIITDENLETSVEGVFAAGDARKSRLRQVVVAAGEGALAAVMVEKYIESLKSSS